MAEEEDPAAARQPANVSSVRNLNLGIEPKVEATSEDAAEGSEIVDIGVPDGADDIGIRDGASTGDATFKDGATVNAQGDGAATEDDAEAENPEA